MRIGEGAGVFQKEEGGFQKAAGGFSPPIAALHWGLVIFVLDRTFFNAALTADACRFTSPGATFTT
ncbi:MAG: hypothetical protein LBS54_09025 [Dysgonamonadaceae bacterium]|nr:hypothetical protein [Dysgonamonadaceae bacterium]